jgi:hypothetical protein
MRSLGEPDAPLVEASEFSSSGESDFTTLSWRSYVALIHQTVAVMKTRAQRSTCDKFLD